MAEKTKAPELPTVGHVVIQNAEDADYERQWSPEFRFAPQPAHNLPPGTAHLPRPVYLSQEEADGETEQAPPYSAPNTLAETPDTTLGVTVAPVKGAGRASV